MTDKPDQSVSTKKCETCDNAGMIRRTKTVTKKGFGSYGCSISTFYFCTNCVPDSDDDLPEGKCRMIVGEMI